jgi:hypothetical protein
MACPIFADFDELTTMRVVSMEFSLPVDENLYVDIWRHLSASYLERDRSSCPGFVSYASTMLLSGCMVSNPLVPRFDKTSSMVRNTIEALLHVIPNADADTRYDRVIFTSFDRNDFTKVTLEPGLFFRDASSTALGYNRLDDIIAAHRSTSTLCIAFKKTLCIVLQTPLPAPTCVHPFADQTPPLAILFDTPNILGFTIQTASDLPYPFQLVAGFSASFIVRPSGAIIARIRSCDVGLVDSSGGSVLWSPIECKALVDSNGIAVVHALNVVDITKVHVFRVVINDDTTVLSYTHPMQHASLPKCTGIVCTVETMAFYRSLRFQCLWDGEVPGGAKWAVRILSSTGHLVATDLSPVEGRDSCLFDYTVASGSTSTATVTLTLGKCSRMTICQTSLAFPFVFGA